VRLGDYDGDALHPRASGVFGYSAADGRVILAGLRSSPTAVEQELDPPFGQCAIQVRSVAPSCCWAAEITFCTDVSTCSPVRVEVGERKIRVTVTDFWPFSRGLPR